MSQSDQAQAIYTRDHLIAKVIIFICYLTVGIISIETATPYLGLIVGTGIWLFGINSTAYMVEAMQGHDHHHNVL